MSTGSIQQSPNYLDYVEKEHLHTIQVRNTSKVSNVIRILKTCIIIIKELNSCEKEQVSTIKVRLSKEVRQWKARNRKHMQNNHKIIWFMLAKNFSIQFE